MFNWITGPRITNAIEDVQTDPAHESTFIEAPETPAHQFAVKAFKHALFGTPAPEDPNNPSKKLEKKAKLDLANTKSAEMPAPKENAPTMSPSKQPGGILLTPGTTGKGRKTVSFGSQVVDNEGKRGNGGKSGIPNDCPGKFPSPWTPGTQLKPDVESDKKPRTKLTEALMDARSNTKPKTTQKPKAKDDIDITLDLSAPRSESGKFWKERYDRYAESSEKEMKKIVAKQQLAKNYAKKKDAEVTELVTRLEQERKRFRRREQELEQQNKDYQERLRQTMGENASANIEIAGLKARIAMLEKSIVEPSSEMHNSRGAFNIFEDTSKEAIHSHLESQNAPELVSFAPSPSMASSGKENSPPKLRHMRRQTLPNSASHPTSSHATRSKLGTDVGEVSILLGKSPHSSAKPSAAVEKPSLAPAFVEQTQSSLHSVRKPEASKENVFLKSPAATGLRSSPLPLPTPEADPWMGVADIEESHIPQMDRMALPISSGPSYSKPTRPIQSRQPTHRVSKSVPHAVKTEAPRSRHQNEKSVLKDEKVEGPGPVSHIRDHISRNAKTVENKFVKKPGENPLHVDIHTSLLPPADPKFDLSKITGHHAEGSSKVTKDRAEMPVDRKAEARRRIDAKKKAKKNGAN